MEAFRSVLFGKILGIVVLYGGMVVMFGWFMQIEILTSIRPDWPSMKFMTAFSFVLSGLLLYTAAAQGQSRSELGGLVLVMLSTLLIFFMGILLVSSLLQIESGFESLFVVEPVEAVLTAVPGRPSVGTMISFLFVAAFGICVGRVRRWSRCSYLLGGLLSGVAILALLGYAADIPQFYYAFSSISSAMAIHTAFLFLFLGLGIISIGSRKKHIGHVDTLGRIYQDV